MPLKTLAAAAAVVLMSLPALAGEAKIMIMDPYARASTPSSKSGAIFFELMNQGAADRLIAARSDVASRTELHTHEEDADGVMKMIHVEEGFDVPSGESVMLERGGKHVMLMGLTGPLEQGATVGLTLVFENAGEMQVEVPVDLNRKPTHGAHGSHGHGHGHGHGADG
ncbi:MAG: copper chaperone PCu(A)C [Pseudomonadota bacterium]